MTAGTNAAILFEPNAFDGDRKQVMGRHIAGAGFLEGFVRHSGVDRYVGVGMRSGHEPVFRRQVAKATAGRPDLAALPVEVLAPQNLRRLGAIGTFQLPDPQLTPFATARRHGDQRAYSLCGVTHTISSGPALATLCDLLTSPVQEWDALICTSTAARVAVLRQIEHHADYLEQRIGRRPVNPIQLPVLPLGVDVGRFERLGDDAAARAAFRQRIGAAENDTVVLYFGRMAFHAKAHPAPMFLGAQRVARRLGPADGRLHLVMTGQFPLKEIEEVYHQGAALYCPDVSVHFIDGTDRPLAEASWAAADLFVSLSDNIQETFGITPVEAMAAGLPCLVSDWDGYRDTVAHGETGMRVPTWLPLAGSGAGIADSYGQDMINYELFVGFTSQMTTVDLPVFTDSLEALVRDPARRRRMGEAGRRRARRNYDWSVIVRGYQEIWADLADRRRVATEIAAPDWRVRNSRLSDPFDVFAGYASAALDLKIELRLDPSAPTLDDVLALPFNTFAANAMLDREGAEALLRMVSEGGLTVQECLGRLPTGRRVRAVRTLGWLAKYGILELGERREMVT